MGEEDKARTAVRMGAAHAHARNRNMSLPTTRTSSFSVSWLRGWMEVRTNGRPRRSIKLKAPRSRRRVGRGHSRAKGRSVHADLYSILLFEIRTLRGRPAAGAVWFALNIDVVQVLFLSEMRQGRRAVLAGYVLCGLTVDGPHSEYSTLSPCVRQRTEKLPLQPQREQQLPRTRSGPAKGWLPRARDMQRM